MMAAVQATNVLRTNSTVCENDGSVTAWINTMFSSPAAIYQDASASVQVLFSGWFVLS